MGYTLVLGGARSGKSRFAEAQAIKLSQASGWPVHYLATGVSTDSEMAARIVEHQKRRPPQWDTIEEPTQVSQWLRQPRDPCVVLLDCLSLLLSNWMYATPDDLDHEVAALCEALASFPHPLLVVSNEVGDGIVPQNGLARRYRDELGWLNQRVAQDAQHVVWMIAGRPVDVLRLAPEW